MTAPITLSAPIRFHATLPASCDVVVVGGGIAGVMTAWHLAGQGVRVVVCEKGRIAAEQSSRNWGWVRQQGRDPSELPIMVESLALWKQLAASLGDGLGFRQVGVTYMARTEKAQARYADWLPHAHANGVDTRLLSRAELDALFPGNRAGWVGGMTTPSDARAEPATAVPVLAQDAVRRGAVIVEGCAVRGIDLAAGKITGVITEAGRIACDQVVVAGGAWSSLFLRRFGVDIPQLSVRESVGMTDPMPDFHGGAAGDDVFALRRTAGGSYIVTPGSERDFYIGPDAFRHLKRFAGVAFDTLRATRFHAAAPKGYPDAWSTPRKWDMDRASPFEAMRVLDPAANPVILSHVQRDLAAAFPAVGRPRLAQTWAGMIDSMPDLVPVIDRVASVPGLVIATGLSGHGFGLGPGLGRVVADLVTGRAVGHDLTAFRLARFGGA